MNILFLTMANINSIDENNIYSDLLKEFTLQNHNVYIASPSERREKKSTHIIEEKNVTILKIKTGNIQKTNFIEKGISTLLLEHNFKKSILKYFSDMKFDLVLYSTPPVIFSSIIKYFKERDEATSYLLLKDIFPQNAVDLGLISKYNPIYWYFRKKEQALYEVSDVIGCMSPENVKYVISNNYVKTKIVEICPNTITPQNIDLKDSEKKSIRQKYDIPIDKTIYVYGGNIGKPQGVDFIVECLRQNEANVETFILIVGSGTEYKRLRKAFDTYKFKKSKLLESMPKSDYELLANASDVGLVFLDSRFTIPNFPSRILSYMQAGMPILLATDKSTDVGRLVEENLFGHWCESTKSDRFIELMNLFKDEVYREELGRNAKRYLNNNYTSKHAYEIIMSHFEK